MPVRPDVLLSFPGRDITHTLTLAIGLVTHVLQTQSQRGFPKASLTQNFATTCQLTVNRVLVDCLLYYLLF